MKVTKTFSLDTDADRDILRWLDAQGNASAAIREAIRAAQGRGSVTLGDGYQVVKELERRLQAGAVTACVSPSSEEWDEPPEAAAALDALAEL